MAFGPELSPKEQARRLAIITKIGAILLPGLLAFVVFAAFGGLTLLSE